MASCTTENWTLADLASALQSMHKDKKKIAVPMFQRGKRWNKSQQNTFIDSLIKGFPVGTMLFYEEIIQDGSQVYILVDGLQRGNCIRKYMNNPTEFFYDSNISDEFCEQVLKVIDKDVPENYSVVREVLTTFIKEQKTFKNIQYYFPSQKIIERFEADNSLVGDLIKVIENFFNERQSLYEQISMTVIPVVVYHGDADNLPEIFDRINSQGTPLDQYEVYAASWPVNKRFKVSNINIVESAIKKYDSFVADGYDIFGYDREKMRNQKEVNAFEYLFGLGKYLIKTYDILGFYKKLPDDTVSSLGFELVNACLNDRKEKIGTLYESIYAIPDIDKFEEALYNAIRFVNDSVSSIFRFKGNRRKGKQPKFKIYHSKFQILSMISTSFKEMYGDGDYEHVSEEWKEKENHIAKNLRQYYVYDILTNYWSEGGNSKIHTVAKPNRYATDIQPRAWNNALNAYYDITMSRTEAKQIANPRNEDFVFLNCIYLNTFTALDQLSIDKFDVEHIATKEQMKKFIQKTNGVGLPISSIANLCYLPEYVNRSKRDKNFYQDKKYLATVSLEDIEQKYSFTVKDDLEWMDLPYEGAKDFEFLKEVYIEYCNKRFSKMKKLFCKSMDIDYEEMTKVQEESTPTESPFDENIEEDRSALRVQSLSKVSEKIGVKLIQQSRNAYTTSDMKKAVVFCESKAYTQGNNEKYWFGYRESAFEKFENCEELYVAYVCRKAQETVLMPKDFIDENKNMMNYSMDSEGQISHYHIVFFRDENGHMTQLLSKPKVQGIDIDQFKL